MTAPDANLTEGERGRLGQFLSERLCQAHGGGPVLCPSCVPRGYHLADSLLASPEFETILTARLTQARAEWLGALVGDECVEAVARSLACLDPEDLWPGNGNEDDTTALYQSAIRFDARAALTAAADLIARTEREHG